MGRSEIEECKDYLIEDGKIARTAKKVCLGIGLVALLAFGGSFFIRNKDARNMALTSTGALMGLSAAEYASFRREEKEYRELFSELKHKGYIKD